MTDLLTRDPNDTGEIPTGVGETTRNLTPYAAGLPPALRRGDALTREIPVYRPAGFTYLDTGTGRPATAVRALIAEQGCRRIDTADPDEFELVPTVPPTPAPVPPPPPDPKVDDLWQVEAPVYRGRHRRASRWDWLTVPLAMAWQRIGRAL